MNSFLFSLNIIFIILNFTKQQYDCQTWDQFQKNFKQLFNNKITWKEIDKEIFDMKMEYYQTCRTVRSEYFTKTIKDITQFIYYPKVEYGRDDLLQNAIRFSKDNEENLDLHFTRLVECAYDENKGMLLFLDRPYQEPFEINNYVHQLKTYQKNNNNLFELYYQTIKTFDTLSEYGVAQMDMKQHYIFYNDPIPYIYVNIFIRCRYVPINETYKDPIANQIVQNGAVTRDAINYIITAITLKFHLYVIDKPFEVSKSYSFNHDSKQREHARRYEIVESFISRFSLYYKPNKPNSLKGLVSKIGAKMDKDFSFIYDFENFVSHLYFTPIDQRRNFKYLMASYNNCFKYSTLADPQEELKIRQQKYKAEMIRLGYDHFLIQIICQNNRKQINSYYFDIFTFIKFCLILFMRIFINCIFITIFQGIYIIII